mgnify:FL=1
MTKPENGTQLQDEGHEPQVYVVQKDLIGWRFSRRDFLAAASAATMATVAGTASGCGDGEPTPAPSTRTPEESATWEACRRVKAHTEPVAQLVITPDGTMLLSRDYGGQVKFWSLPDGTLLKTAQGHAMAVSPDGKSLILGDVDGALHLWLLPRMAPVRSVGGHLDAVRTLAASADWTVLASGSQDGTIKLWSLP